MESLADSGLLAGFIDLTTTEVADMLVGGVFPCDGDRFGAAIRTGLPYVGSVGAMDMVNFGPRDTVPGEISQAAASSIHNPNVTLMRTTPDENRAIGEWIGERLNQMEGPVRLLLPEGRRLRARRAGQALPRPGGRRGAVRGARADGPPDAASGASSASRRTSTTTPSSRRRRRRSSPSDRAARGEPDAASRAPGDPGKFQAMKEARRPIIGGGAGTGPVRQMRGGRRHRPHRHLQFRPIPHGGRGSLAGLLAYGNANEIVREMAHEVLPVVKRTPVLAGVNGTDPFCLFDPFLDDLKRLGFSGVQNFPTVGLIDGILRANLEETGMSYALEVEMIALARAKDMLTTPYVFSAADAAAMAKAGADIIVCHLGLTTGGAIGAQTGRKLEGLPGADRRMGGGRARCQSAGRSCSRMAAPWPSRRTPNSSCRSTRHCHGFYGASSMERLPTERAMADQTRQFKAITFGHAQASREIIDSGRAKLSDR